MNRNAGTGQNLISIVFFIICMGKLVDWQYEKMERKLRTGSFCSWIAFIFCTNQSQLLKNIHESVKLESKFVVDQDFNLKRNLNLFSILFIDCKRRWKARSKTNNGSCSQYIKRTRWWQWWNYQVSWGGWQQCPSTFITLTFMDVTQLILAWGYQTNVW